MNDKTKPAPLGSIKFAGPHELHDDPLEAVRAWGEYVEGTLERIERLEKTNVQLVDRCDREVERARQESNRRKDAEHERDLSRQDVETMRTTFGQVIELLAANCPEHEEVAKAIGMCRTMLKVDEPLKLERRQHKIEVVDLVSNEQRSAIGKAAAAAFDKLPGARSALVLGTFPTDDPDHVSTIVGVCITDGPLGLQEYTRLVVDAPEDVRAWSERVRRGKPTLSYNRPNMPRWSRRKK